MPKVSDEFVKSAKALAAGVAEMIQKKASDKDTLKKQAEVVADTLIARGLVPSAEKQAAVSRLLDHENALSALNRTAQEVEAHSLGTPEKSASTKSDIRESDRVLFERLGIGL